MTLRGIVGRRLGGLGRLGGISDAIGIGTTLCLLCGAGTVGYCYCAFWYWYYMVLCCVFSK